MTQKRMKSVRGTLANREAPRMTPKAGMMKKKISNANTTKGNRISDIKKSNLSRCQQKKKKKSIHTCRIVEMDNSQGSIISQQDLLRQILSCLPVQSLLRFKCVAKSWDITSDPYFRLKHNVNSLRFLLAHTNFRRPQNVHNLYSTSSLSSPDDLQNIDYLTSDDTRFHILCGSCDGLILIRLPNRHNHELLLLWNPSTRESVHIPFPIFGLKNSTFGFGYDPTTHDYKILAIHKIKSQPQCGILALKSGSWRNVYIESPLLFTTRKDAFGFENPLSFVHGAFQWVTWRLCVGSFNISNEVYTIIPFSEQMSSYLSHIGSGDYHVSILDGMVCFSSACKVDGEYAFTLWEMKEYGVKESWTQLFKIKIAAISIVKPVYRFADGDVLFQCRDIIRDSFRTPKGRFRLWCDSLVKRGDMINIVTFNESLIDPKTLI
ncbi:F-box/kelch-repeat protein At3g23880-like [Solanum stenotomum]|uniref:F-box/kelch-repeat protein At3g23880-like n=1 Tax=Solanum stenotomum TaxID=172797 RepID=UPI0020D11982|nr:F-box/kelch-repeat protein At3g23880-like [Solanum stenotomum]